MSCCINAASACIFASCVGECAVSSATFCLISGEASRLPCDSAVYHEPISTQLVNGRLTPPGGIIDTIIIPATAFIGGMSSSCRNSATSFTSHCQPLGPADVGVSSA